MVWASVVYLAHIIVSFIDASSAKRCPQTKSYQKQESIPVGCVLPTRHSTEGLFPSGGVSLTETPPLPGLRPQEGTWDRKREWHHTKNLPPRTEWHTRVKTLPCPKLCLLVVIKRVSTCPCSFLFSMYFSQENYTFITLGINQLQPHICILCWSSSKIRSSLYKEFFQHFIIFNYADPSTRNSP